MILTDGEDVTSTELETTFNSALDPGYTKDGLVFRTNETIFEDNLMSTSVMSEYKSSMVPSTDQSTDSISTTEEDFQTTEKETDWITTSLASNETYEMGTTALNEISLLQTTGAYLMLGTSDAYSSVDMHDILTTNMLTAEVQKLSTYATSQIFPETTTGYASSDRPSTEQTSEAYSTQAYTTRGIETTTGKLTILICKHSCSKESFKQL